MHQEALPHRLRSLARPVRPFSETIRKQIVRSRFVASVIQTDGVGRYFSINVLATLRAVSQTFDSGAI